MPHYLIGANGPFVQTLVVFRKDSAVAQVLVTSYREHPPQQAAVILAHLLEERIELLGRRPVKVVTIAQMRALEEHAFPEGMSSPCLWNGRG